MKTKYRETLEKVYEVEGLLLLAMSKDTTPEGLDELIERKISELMADERQQAENEPEPEPSPVTEKKAEPRKEASIERQAPLAEQESPYYALEDEDEERPEPARQKNVQSGANRRPQGAVRQEDRTRKQPIFSLNDRFLFMRELFGGDASAFNAALNRIAALSNIDEARDYLVGECGVNPEAGEVDERFHIIIEEYFRSRGR